MGWGWTCPYRVCDNYSRLLVKSSNYRIMRWGWNSYLIKQEGGQTFPEFTCVQADFCEDHPLFKRKDFEYPMYLKPCCYQNDYVN